MSPKPFQITATLYPEQELRTKRYQRSWRDSDREDKVTRDFGYDVTRRTLTLSRSIFIPGTNQTKRFPGLRGASQGELRSPPLLGGLEKQPGGAETASPLPGASTGPSLWTQPSAPAPFPPRPQPHRGGRVRQAEVAGA